MCLQFDPSAAVARAAVLQLFLASPSKEAALAVKAAAADTLQAW